MLKALRLSSSCSLVGRDCIDTSTGCLRNLDSTLFRIARPHERVIVSLPLEFTLSPDFYLVLMQSRVAEAVELLAVFFIVVSATSRKPPRRAFAHACVTLHRAMPHIGHRSRLGACQLSLRSSWCMDVQARKNKSLQ